MSEYYYLISSLPLLLWGDEPPYTAEKYVRLCSDWISEKQSSELNDLTLTPPPGSEEGIYNSIVAEWYSWESNLRNSIITSRTPALKKDIENDLRHETDFYSETERGVQDAFAAHNPLEREKVLDQLRWKKVDDMESGHMFDFENLCLYKIKLMLLSRWTERLEDQGQKNLEEIATVTYQQKQKLIEENYSD